MSTSHLLPAADSSAPYVMAGRHIVGTPSLPQYGPDYRPATAGRVVVRCSGDDAADAAAGWIGSDWYSRICDAPVRRGGSAALCGQTLRPSLSGQYVCPSHGADAPSHFPSDAPADSHLPGTRSGARRADRTDHFAWCSAAVTTGAGRSRRSVACAQVGRSDGWECPDHGGADVVGCDVPRPVDDGLPAAVLGHDAAGRSRYVDGPRGESIKSASRTSYAARSNGRRSLQVTPEPSQPVMASGKWPTRTGAARSDGGAVVVTTGAAALRIAPAAAMTYRGEHRSADERPLSGVVLSGGAPSRIAPARDGRGTLARLTSAQRSAIVAACPAAAPAIDSQLGATRAVRTRSATVAASAATAKRSATAKRATATARAERAAQLESLAALAASIKSPAALAYVASERSRKVPSSR